jgi:pimeloyl-ACP methyl ester carboxylesterase
MSKPYFLPLVLNAQRATLTLRLSLFRLALTLTCLAAFVGCKTNSPSVSRQPAAGQKSTYVIVHGAWGGGWDWKNVGNLLTADGKTVVYRPTLAGLGEHYNLSNTNIDLSTHIQDVVNVILWENLHDIVLVGHSYGGMVITGVADRVPDRIKRVVYIDAIVPENGETVDMTRHHGTNDPPVVDGLIIPKGVVGNPPPPHDVPQSLKTIYEPITLTNQAVAGKLPTTYILTVEKGKPTEEDDFHRFYQRAQARGWQALIMEGDHIVERSHPFEVVTLLEHAP